MRAARPTEMYAEPGDRILCFPPAKAGWPLSTQASLGPVRNLYPKIMRRVCFDFSSPVITLKPVEKEIFKSEAMKERGFESVSPILPPHTRVWSRKLPSLSSNSDALKTTSVSAELPALPTKPPSSSCPREVDLVFYYLR